MATPLPTIIVTMAILTTKKSVRKKTAYPQPAFNYLSSHFRFKWSTKMACYKKFKLFKQAAANKKLPCCFTSCPCEPKDNRKCSPKKSSLYICRLFNIRHKTLTDNIQPPSNLGSMFHILFLLKGVLVAIQHYSPR